MRLFIQGISYYNANIYVENPADPRYINAIFAGVLLETIFLVIAHSPHAAQTYVELAAYIEFVVWTP